ncbi:MAG: GspH/FimT family pseudopilin [Thermosynechococcaceae cyanobacterium]
MINFLKANARRSLFRQYIGADNAGVTMPELMAVIAITGVLAAIAAPSMSFGTEPLRDTTNRVSANLKMARSKAMAQTSAYRVRPISNGEMVIERATNCDDTNWTRDAGFSDEDLTFDDDIVLDSVTSDGNPVANITSWTVCFDSRGMTDQTLVLTLENLEKDQTQELQIFRGGTINLGTLVASF